MHEKWSHPILHKLLIVQVTIILVILSDHNLTNPNYLDITHRYLKLRNGINIIKTSPLSLNQWMWFTDIQTNLSKYLTFLNNLEAASYDTGSLRKTLVICKPLVKPKSLNGSLRQFLFESIQYNVVCQITEKNNFYSTQPDFPC